MNLFVARLDTSMTGDDLLNLFSQYGEVTSAKVIIDRETGNSKGFGFVEMPNDEEAKKAIEALNESELNGKQIVVKEANERSSDGSSGRNFQQRRPGGFQNRGGGSGFQRRDNNRGPRRESRSDDRRSDGGGFQRYGDRKPRTGGSESGNRW
jgi:RNA recognition motif-containing protein